MDQQQVVVAQVELASVPKQVEAILLTDHNLLALLGRTHCDYEQTPWRFSLG